MNSALNHGPESFVSKPGKELIGIYRMWTRMFSVALSIDQDLSNSLCSFRNIAPISSPPPLKITQPFVVYSDAFASILGENPTLELLITDPRAPYFHSGGAWIPRLSTLFLTSNLIRDPEPSAIASAHKRTEITKIEFYGEHGVNRDKVRCPEQDYMAAGCTVYPNSDSGVVICAQGSLKGSSGLVYIETKRPHKARMLLNNYQGKPFNSPCDVISNHLDGALYFIDPAYGYERGFRPKAQLPTGHIYRFDPNSGSCRVLTLGLNRPCGLAFSPDYSVLYVSDLGDKYGGTTIHAFDIHYTNAPSSGPSFQISVSNGLNNGTSAINGIHKSTPSSSTQSTKSNSSTGQYRLMPTSPPPMIRAESGTTTYSRSRSRGPTEIRSPTLGPVPSLRTTGTQGPTFTVAHLLNKRTYAYSVAPGSSGGISTDPIHGHLFLGTGEGVEIWSGDTAELLGKILVDEDGAEGNNRGVSKVAFGNDGEAWLFGGERVWRARIGRTSGDRFLSV